MQIIRLAIVSIVLLVFVALVGACANDKDTSASQEDLTVTQMNMACSLESLPKLPDRPHNISRPRKQRLCPIAKSRA